MMKVVRCSKLKESKTCGPSTFSALREKERAYVCSAESQERVPRLNFVELQ